MSYAAKITAIGTYVPSEIITNEDMEKLVETSHEWIVQRTGIEERRRAADQEFTSHLAIQAVEDLVHSYQKDLSDVDFILVATSTPDYRFPSVAALVQSAFHIQGTGAVDLGAACAGFTYGLQMAQALIAAGTHRKVLLIGAETLTKITNYEDRTTCILFGDGAGAVLIERGHPAGALWPIIHGTDGRGAASVYSTALSTEFNSKPLEGNGQIVQNGREVYRWAVSTVSEGVNSLLERAGETIESMDGFVFHNANLRMIEAICERTGIPEAKAFTSLQRHGNTSAASIPLALDAAIRSNRVAAGAKLLLYGFGSGLVHAGVVLSWEP